MLHARSIPGRSVQRLRTHRLPVIVNGWLSDPAEWRGCDNHGILLYWLLQP
jgi:hypothetical protein